MIKRGALDIEEIIAAEIHDADYKPLPIGPCQERAAFEAEFSKPPYEWHLARWGENGAWPGHYIGYHVETAWQGWLASAQHRRAK